MSFNEEFRSRRAFEGQVVRLDGSLHRFHGVVDNSVINDI